jgi:hypothetical protein
VRTIKGSHELKSCMNVHDPSISGWRVLTKQALG